MLALFFTRSGPGVLDIMDELQILRLPDYIRMGSVRDARTWDTPPILDALPIRKFTRQRLALPEDMGEAWAGWAQTERGPRGEYVVPIYVEESAR